MKNESSKKPIDWIRVALYVFTGLVIAYIMMPLLIVIINSFNSVAFSSFPPQGFSLQWYENLLSQKQFMRGFVNSVKVGIVATAIAMFAGVLAAYVFHRYRFRGRDIVQSYFMSPMVMPKIVLGIALFMYFLRANLFGTLTSLYLAHAIVCFPFVVSIITSSLVALDITLEEAAKDLGARGWQSFIRVVLPQIRVSLVIAALFSFIISFDQVDTTLFLVRPQNNTLPIEMFLYLEKWQDPTMAALSTILIGFSFCFVFLGSRLLKQAPMFKNMYK